MEKRVTTPHPIAPRAMRLVKKTRETPPLLPERSLMRAFPLLPLTAKSSSRAVLPPPPTAKSSLHRTQDTPPKKDSIILSPIPQRGPSQAAVLSSSSFSSESEVQLQEDYELKRMISDYHADRGEFSPEKLRERGKRGIVDIYPYPSSRYPNVWIGSEKEAEGEAEEVFGAQAKLFDIADDVRTFRNPFVNQGATTNDLDDILSIAASPATKAKKVSEESVERACDDESIHGLIQSPKISPRSSDAETTEANAVEEAVSEEAATEIAPKKERGVGHDMFIGRHSFSLSEDEEEKAEERVEEQDEIFNPHGDHFAFPGGRWSIVLPSRSESRKSQYSTPSRLPSPVPRIRDREMIIYSPIENPWASGIDSASASNQLQDAASEFFSSFDVEALVASTQDPGYELANTDERKGSPDYYILNPHEPEMSCKCYFCDKHYHPTLDVLKAHDPSDWCHCSACEGFRENEDVERYRARQVAAWQARFDELAAEVDDAKAEEESRLLDLTVFKEEDNQDEFRPKITHRLGDWVRRHLRSPSPRE
jgi:hypothetical protein